MNKISGVGLSNSTLELEPPFKVVALWAHHHPITFYGTAMGNESGKIISTGSSVKGKKMRTKQGLSFTKRVTDFVTDRASITKDFGSGDFFSYS